MMINLSKNTFFSGRGKASRVLLLILIIVLLLVVLNVCSKNVRNLFYSISKPFQGFFWKAGERSSGFLSPFLVVHKIKAENADLTAENQRLLSELSSLEELEAENESLREALNAGLQEEFKITAVDVISKDVLKDFILIDKGSEDGISEGMPLINQYKVFFGKVSEVFKSFSKVILISDKDFISNVKVQEKEVYGVVRGSGSLSLYFDLVPRDSDLQEGDILVTSSIGGLFPKDLLVGRVSRVIKEDTKSFQTADIEPFFNIKSADNLLVITNFKR